ncbi:MAG TPA: glycosyltransferase family 2 protein [Burkholderiales bacterium]|nr:glycosyltransferase family 2 protein [Burkholderiales bacterium]
MQLAVVVPCYNEQDVLPETSRRLLGVLDRLAADGLASHASRVYFVDDGSRDRTWTEIEALAQGDGRVYGIKLSRNRGHQNALVAGLFTAEGDAIVSIDADLQDDVDVIQEMVQRYHEGSEVVYGVREDRSSDSLFKRFSAELYYRLLGLMGVQVVFNHADYRLLSRRAIEALREYREVNLFLRGIIPMLGFKTATVSYKRSARRAGESKYPLRKMVSLAVDGVTSFSATPLRLITALGLLVCLGSFALVAWALWLRLFTDQAVPGWTSTVLPIYFLGGVQLLCIGVIGEYLAKIYLEVKARPRFVIEQVVGGEASLRASVSEADSAIGRASDRQRKGLVA